jgi:hypothetical protein
MILAEATGEVLLVQAVNSGTNTLTVARGIGATTAAVGSVADDAYLQQIGAASGEGAAAPDAGASAPTKHTNYMQTFRESVELSGRLASEDARFGDTAAEQRQWKFQELLRDIESAIVHGVANDSAVDANGKRVFTMGGLLAAITTNVDNVGGTMTLARWNQFLEVAFAYGMNDKILAAGPTLLTALHTLYGAQVRSSPNEPVGLTMQVAETPYGRLRFMPHRGLLGSFAGYGIVVDPSDAQVVFKTGERGEPHMKVNSPGTEDAVKEEWMGELTLKWGSESSHAVIQGVTGAA